MNNKQKQNELKTEKTKKQKNKQNTLDQFLEHSNSNMSLQSDVENQDDKQQYLKKYKNYKAVLPQDNGNVPLLQIDQQQAKYWYYSIHKTFREYQFKIVETCLYNNTMVCLPTGLGKTFIAANTIFNYYKWFPEGKIFFLAPTRPLVKQQLDSVNAFQGINKQDVVELTGQIPWMQRKELYKQKKIFFMTPQSLQNDLQEKRYDGNSVSLIVFDEAHHGTGKYSYTQIINILEDLAYGYRILALSATPGNEKEQIKEVIQNMKISRLEVKDDEDPDVKQYVYEKEVEEVVIKANFCLKNILESLNKVIQSPYEWLCKVQIVPPRVKRVVKNIAQLNRGLFYEVLKYFQSNIEDLTQKLGPATMSIAFEHVKVMSQLTHGKKILNDQSISVFHKWLTEFQEKAQTEKKRNVSKIDLMKKPEFQELVSKTSKSMGITCDEEEENQDNDQKNIHPKTVKLIQILQEFFQDPENQQKKSKVMLFTQNRNNVQELHRYISKNCLNSLLRPAIFVGQASNSPTDIGMNQKQQLKNIQDFKDDIYNVLIATCIGEEGLDIGEIDLIICYDSGFSPIRMIQRMGRTGRKREGKVKILLMEGKEYRTYQESIKNSKKLKKFLKQCAEYQKKKLKTPSNKISKIMNPNLELGYYSFSPRMIPEEIEFPELVFLENQINGKKKSSYNQISSKTKDNENKENQDDKETKKLLKKQKKSKNLKKKKQEQNKIQADDTQSDYDSQSISDQSFQSFQSISFGPQNDISNKQEEEKINKSSEIFYQNNQKETQQQKINNNANDSNINSITELNETFEIQDSFSEDSDDQLILKQVQEENVQIDKKSNQLYSKQQSSPKVKMLEEDIKKQKNQKKCDNIENKDNVKYLNFSEIQLQFPQNKENKEAVKKIQQIEQQKVQESVNDEDEEFFDIDEFLAENEISQNQNTKNDEQSLISTCKNQSNQKQFKIQKNLDDSLDSIDFDDISQQFNQAVNFQTFRNQQNMSDIKQLNNCYNAEQVKIQKISLNAKNQKIQENEDTSSDIGDLDEILKECENQQNLVNTQHAQNHNIQSQNKKRKINPFQNNINQINKQVLQ